MRKLLFPLVALILLAAPAHAQQWIQVTNCNTPPRTLPPGAAATILVDSLGNICEKSTLGAITQIVSDNIVQWGSTAVITGGVAGSPGIGGNIATGTQATGNPINNGGMATNAEPLAAGNGQIQNMVLDLVGRVINFPYTQKENLVANQLQLTSTTAVALIPTQSNFTYLTSLSCFNTTPQATGSDVFLSNGSTGATIYTMALRNTPSSFAITFPSPLGGSQIVSANTAIHAKLSATPAAVVCDASGFKGS